MEARHVVLQLDVVDISKQCRTTLQERNKSVMSIHQTQRVTSTHLQPSRAFHYQLSHTAIAEVTTCELLSVVSIGSGRKAQRKEIEVPHTP